MMSSGATTLEKDACRGFTHIVQRLPDSREPRVVIARNLNVVESNHGDIFRYTQIRIAQSANRTDGRNVIERYERGELAPVLQKLLDNGVAKLRRSQIALELDSKIRRNFENEITSDSNDAAPTIIRIGTERLPAHERDVTMTQLMQVSECEFGFIPPQGETARGPNGVSLQNELWVPAASGFAASRPFVVGEPSISGQS